LRIASTTGPSSWITFDWTTVGGSAAMPSAVTAGRSPSVLDLGELHAARADVEHEEAALAAKRF
jgi:hypothetical protein